MAIGLGIILILLGLVFALGVITYDIPNVDEPTLGWILVIVGVLALVISLVINAQRGRTRTEVVERRDGYDGRRP